MAQETLNAPASPYEGPNTRDTTPERGDNWKDFIAKCGRMFTELYARSTTLTALLAAVAGTVTASLALIVDANKDLGRLRNLRVTRLVRGEGAATSDATAGARTYTAAEILGGIIVRDCAGAGRTDVLPTAALLVAALPGAAVGDIIECLIVNGSDGAETITLDAGSGGGYDANQIAASRIIPQNASKLLRIRLTNVTASSEAYVAYL